MATRPLAGSPAITQVWGEPSSLYSLGYHTGVDYGVGNGTAVLSPTNGTITQVGDGRAQSDGRGFFMKIRGDDGVEHNLYHLARWHVGGGRVGEGQHVADSDNTGLSSGPHLHWETRRSPYALANNFNPADWLYAAAPAPAPAPTPAPATLQPNQRILSNEDGVNQRTEPNTGSAVIKEWPYDQEPFSFKAYVRGEDPYGLGNNIWYVGQYSGGYFYSGAFKNPTTDGLNDQTPSPTPVPVPTPAPVETTPPQPPVPVDFKPDDTSVIATYATVNQSAGTQTPKFIVIHWWDDPAKKPTLQGVINHFKDPRPDNPDAAVSAHYIVDNSGVYQMVPENKRAWHAGATGNDGLGIECDPNGGDAMYTHLRLLVANIRVRHGLLALRKHSDIMKTACPGTINLLRIEPISVPPTLPPSDLDQENNALLKQILAAVQWIKDKLLSIFK